MKVKSSSWNQIIPYFVAAIAIAYLIYVLVVQGDSLQYIHFCIFLLIVVLVLAPIAGRLKIWNLVDFNSKFESLRKENKKELDQIRNQVSSVIQTSIMPMQHQWTILGVDEQMVKKLAESIKEQFKIELFPSDFDSIKESGSARDQFLRRADIYRYRTYDILVIARMFQIAIREHRTHKDGDIGAGNMDDKISRMLKHILDDGVELFVPEEKVAETTEKLKSVEKLLELYKSVNSKEIDLCSEQESNQLFENIGNSIQRIWAGIILYGSQAIVAQQNIMRMLKELDKELEDSSDSPENKS